MKRCASCGVDVIVPRVHCPLCAAPLTGEAPEEQREVYPPLPTLYKEYHLLFRVLIFVSVAGGAVSLLLNLAFPQGGWWSFLVLAGIVYMWITILYGVRRVHRASRSVLFQMVATAGVAVLIDSLYGHYGWAIDYAVPALCLSAMMAIGVVALVSRIGIEEFIMYFLINALLGLVPLVFVLTGLAETVWPSMTCVLLSVLSLAAVFIFGGDEIRQELKKRFHV